MVGTGYIALLILTSIAGNGAQHLAPCVNVPNAPDANAAKAMRAMRSEWNPTIWPE